MSNTIELAEPGAFIIIVTVSWAANGSGARTVGLRIKRDGVDVDYTNVVGAPGENGFITQQLVRVFIAEGGETLQVEVRQSSGANLAISAAQTNVQVARLAG